MTLQIHRPQWLLPFGVAALIATSVLGQQPDPATGSGRPSETLQPPTNETPTTGLGSSIESLAPAVERFAPAVARIVSALHGSRIDEVGRKREYGFMHVQITEPSWTSRWRGVIHWAVVLYAETGLLAQAVPERRCSRLCFILFEQ
jgi:hypothetical protein